MILKKAKKGVVYRIRHKRKGDFIGEVIGIEENDDPLDPFIIVVKYDVRYGTDQAHLQRTDVKDANTGEPAPVRVSGLRPSLILSMEKTEEQELLRKVKVPEEVHREEEKAGFLKRILGR